MITVYFDSEHSLNLGSASSYEEAWTIMADFIHNEEKINGFHWHYTRISLIDEKKTIHFDVSSHTEFFRFVFDREEEYITACDAIRKSADRDKKTECC